jgi:adenylate kinase
MRRFFLFLHFVTLPNMSIIKLHDNYFKPYISKEKVDKSVKLLANQIAKDFKDEVPIFIGILNGSFILAADIVRNYPYNCEVSFVKLSSYEGTKSSGKVNELIGINEDLSNRTVIILEDIIDTGSTLQKIYDIFKTKNLKTLKVASLFLKPDVFKKELPIDYLGMSIPDEFIVGYGMDYNNLGRNLNSIYKITTQTMTNIVLFGPPGAGKGTQADSLKEKYNLVHISTGDIFRYNIKNKTELGVLAKSYMDDGNLVPDEVTINMLEEEVNKNAGVKGFIFDGFPRTTSQAKALDTFLSKKGETIDGMIALEVTEDLLVARLLERGKTSGRPDDQDETKIRNRFNEYNTKTAVLKDYYTNQNKYFGADGVGSIEEITNRLSNIIDTL